MSRFDYVAYDSESEVQQKAFKAMYTQISSEIEKSKPGRAQALALTKLEESYMWIGKMVRDQQIARTENVTLNEKRETILPTHTPPSVL